MRGELHELQEGASFAVQPRPSAVMTDLRVYNRIP